MGSLIAVRSVCAGAGRSVISLNLAFEVAGYGSRTLLIDLDDVWPSLHRHCALPQQQAAVLAATRLLEQGKLDANALEELVVRLVVKGVGVDFLSGFGLNLNAQAINHESVSSLLQFLANRYDHIIIDCPAGLVSPMNRTVAQLSSSVVLVTQTDVVNMGRFIDVQAQISDALTGANSVILTLNRMRSSVLGSRPQWQVQQVLKEHTSFASAVIIPEDTTFDESLLKGVPLRQLGTKSLGLAAIGELAALLQ